MIRKLTYFALTLGLGMLIVCSIMPYSRIFVVFAVVIIALSTLFFILGVIRIQMSFFVNNVCIIPYPGSWVALTFDDGPHQETERLLDILDKHQVKASFFCIGKAAEKYPDTILRIVKSGHTIGSHTFSHDWRYTLPSFSGVESEIAQGVESINKITGKRPNLFRPPFGITNPKIAKAIKSQKLTSVGWSIRTFDTTLNDSSELLKKVTDKLTPGSIILMHDRLKITVDAMSSILDEIKRRGLVPITLDEVFKNSQND